MYVPSQIEFATNIKSILFTQQVDTVLTNKILAFVSLQIDDHNFISLDGTRYITVYMYTSTAAILPDAYHAIWRAFRISSHCCCLVTSPLKPTKATLELR